jgi:hypothetical protein
MKFLFLIFFALIAIYDLLTTIQGTASILHAEGLVYAIAIGFAIIISFLLLNTIPIIRNPKGGFIYSGAKFLWLLALLYDLYTSFIGSINLILKDKIGDANLGPILSEMSQTDMPQLVIIIGLTIFITASPIAISFLLYEAEFE